MYKPQKKDIKVLLSKTNDSSSVMNFQIPKYTALYKGMEEKKRHSIDLNSLKMNLNHMIGGQYDLPSIYKKLNMT